MKLTLRKARKLADSKIPAYDFEYKNPSLNVRQILTMTEDELQQLFTKSSIKANDKLLQELKLNDLRYKLRFMISKLNYECGINELLTRKAGLENEIRRIEIALSRATKQTPADLIYKAKKIDESSNTSNYCESNREFEIPELLFEGDTYNNMKIDRIVLKKEIEDIEDAVLRLNNTITVNIEKDEVEFLKKLNLC